MASNGRLTIWIDEREALPVRAIPYVAGWEYAYSPDIVAENLARAVGAPFDKLRNLVAYHRPAKRPQQVMPHEWKAVVAKLKGFETGWHEQRPDISVEDDHVGYAAWRQEAASKLPAGVFVWLDEFVREHQADRKRTLAPDDRPVILAPMLDAESRAAVLEGFEDCPRRSSQADQAMIGYSEFVAICHVDSPKNFGGFRLETDGLYVVIPDADAILTPAERAAVTWHPTGDHERPALPLPCTLGQLRAFLPNAGMLGYLDEDEVDAVLPNDGCAGKSATTYKNICKCLDGYWEKPWHELPAEQRQAWREALVINFDELDAGRRWDGYTVEQRQGVAGTYDAGHDPALEGERFIAWHDVTMNARTWFDMPDVEPKPAAMVLCRINPLTDKDPENIFVDDDESSPARYRLLLAMFESTARAVPRLRTLMEWRAIAQEKGLRYHSWIDAYVQATDRKSAVPDTNNLAGAPASEDAAAVAGASLTSLPNGVPTAEIIASFKLTNAWADKLRHIRKNPFLKPALVVKGSRQSSNTPRASALWNPVKLAELLIDREKKSRKAMARIIEHRFPKWQDNWDAAQSVDESPEWDDGIEPA